VIPNLSPTYKMVATQKRCHPQTACYKCGFVDPDKPSAAAPATSAVNGAGEGKAEESKEDTKSASASGAGAPSVVICVEGLVGDKVYHSLRRTLRPQSPRETDR